LIVLAINVVAYVRVRRELAKLRRALRWRDLAGGTD
jgi:hypothetical protein